MPVKGSKLDETPYGRYITSDGWFVLNLSTRSPLRNEEKGGAAYPSSRGSAVRRLRRPRPRPLAWASERLYHSEEAQEGFLVLSGECTLIVEEEERPLRQWDYFHCPADTRHVIVGAGDGPCAILMIGARPDVESCATRSARSRRSTARPPPGHPRWR